MDRADLFRQLSEPTAARVSSAVQHLLEELTTLLSLMRETETGPVAAELEKAVAAVVAAAVNELARPVFSAHPRVVPDTLAESIGAVSVEEEITTDENEVGDAQPG